MKYLLILILPGLLCAAPITYYPKKDLPAEFSYLIESIQLYPLENKEREILGENIKELDQMLSELTKEEVYFLLKSEIYKGLLERPKLKKQNIYYNPEILKSLNSIIEVRLDDYHKFAQWLLFAVYTDLRQIFDSPFYNTFIVKKKTGLPLKSKNLLMMQKRFDFILPWYEEIINSTPEELHESIKENMFDLLNIIEIKVNDLIKFSRFEKFKLDPNKKTLSFFTTKTLLEGQKDIKEEKMLDITIEESPKVMAKQEWIPKNAPMDPNPDYTPPKVLPAPVNDW
ncbi:MAG: hypothetical protein DRQ88_07140 [Epsilonproteobacteria bacterium]|nr:MAG: hypothetical protein DRQ89_03275 [Campylobacterota bacterium]RLA66257.1 MAG: hypothetical protein DRQ88_07140 [Campylobacterota bacterium]